MVRQTDRLRRDSHMLPFRSHLYFKKDYFNFFINELHVRQRVDGSRRTYLHTITVIIDITQFETNKICTNPHTFRTINKITR